MQAGAGRCMYNIMTPRAAESESALFVSRQPCPPAGERVDQNFKQQSKKVHFSCQDRDM